MPIVKCKRCSKNFEITNPKSRAVYCVICHKLVIKERRAKYPTYQKMKELLPTQFEKDPNYDTWQKEFKWREDNLLANQPQSPFELR